MKNQKRGVSLTLVFLLIAVLAMTIGFATYNATLTINGNVTAKAASWNVQYLTANSITESTNSVHAVTTDSATELTATNYKFTVTLEKPGDFYEGTVYVKNFGTIPAKLTGITMSTLTAAQQNYLTYTVTYNDTPYTASASNLNVALAAGASIPVKVRVEYVLPENASNLPAEDQTVTVTGSFTYADAL